MQTYYLVHHGVKGQKWGVRRYDDESYESRVKRIFSDTKDAKNAIKRYNAASSYEKDKMDKLSKRTARGMARMENRHEKIKEKKNAAILKLNEKSKAEKEKLLSSGASKDKLDALSAKIDKRMANIDIKQIKRERRYNSRYRSQILRARVMKMMNKGYKDFLGGESTYKNTGNRVINQLMQDKGAPLRLGFKHYLGLSLFNI